MKRIIMINGNPNAESNGFDEYCDDLGRALAVRGNEVQQLILRDKEIADCIGCYACWLKTPGICALNDDQAEVLKGLVWADWVIMTSPMIMGFVSSLLKKANDRMIPLAHPFLRMDENRMAHYHRYDTDLKAGLIIGSNGSIDPEEREIVDKVYRWMDFIKTTQELVEEVADEINNL